MFESWMEWADEQGWHSFINFELRCEELDRARIIFERFALFTRMSRIGLSTPNLKRKMDVLTKQERYMRGLLNTFLMITSANYCSWHLQGQKKVYTNKIYNFIKYNIDFVLTCSLACHVELCTNLHKFIFMCGGVFTIGQWSPLDESCPSRQICSISKSIDQITQL